MFPQTFCYFFFEKKLELTAIGKSTELDKVYSAISFKKRMEPEKGWFKGKVRLVSTSKQSSYVFDAAKHLDDLLDLFEDKEEVAM